MNFYNINLLLFIILIFLYKFIKYKNIKEIELFDWKHQVNNKVYEHFTINYNSWWLPDPLVQTKNLFNKLFEDIETSKKLHIYSIFGNYPPSEKEEDVILIQFSGESWNFDTKLYDLNLIPGEVQEDKNVIIFPYAFYHILFCDMDINRFVNKRLLDTEKTNFCLFTVSNGTSEIRNNFFDELYKHKHIDSCGRFKNNMTCLGNNHESPDYFSFISKYKFMICFENTSVPNYFTEKLINAYYNGTIPIYWGCPNISDYVNMDSILYLPSKPTQSDIDELIKKILYLDNNDDAYKAMYENCFFKNGIIPDEFNLDKVKLKIKNALS